MRAWYICPNREQEKVVRWWFGNVVVEFLFKVFNRRRVLSIVWKTGPTARG